jgi:glycyl-tRNA synthetase beta chain
MPQFLLELFSEEIPARMQSQAARDLARLAEERLKAAGLAYDSLKTYAGPRRLTLVIEGLPAAQEDRSEEVKGPRANAPEQALQGFLRKTGLTRKDLFERDGVFFASLSQKGRATPEILSEMVEAILKGFPWPKSMRWGAGTFRWVRPLKRILALFDGAVVPVEIAGIQSGDLTEGHRFMGLSHEPFKVSHFDHYKDALFNHFVILDQIDRKRLILDGARAACAAKGLELVEDEGLLEEVSGLAEWPVPVLGEMDPAFLDLPPEVIRTSMRTHQKYFAVRDPKTGTLAPNFLVVANIAAPDGGTILAAGNAKVLSARLSDAQFFWSEDRKISLEERRLKLAGVTFHAKLGTMLERAERIEALAREIAPLVGADPALAGIAARLSKADLATGMVGEFPELQGIMGGYYARLEPFPLEGGRAGMGVSGAVGAVHSTGGASGALSPAPGASTPIPDPSPLEGEGGFEPDGSEDPGSSIEDILAFAPPQPARWFDGLSAAEVDQVADAVRDHYKPAGPSDSVPTAPVTVALALADKLDTLVGFFAIDDKPTGSRDPFALRRAALGVIRLLQVTGRSVSLRIYLERSLLIHQLTEVRRFKPRLEGVSQLVFENVGQGQRLIIHVTGEAPTGIALPLDTVVADELLAFFADRLKVLLRDEGKRHDLVDAVFAPIGGQADDDLVRIVARVEALSVFLATEDGASLLAGYKRATNILKAEEKKASLPLQGGGIEGGGVWRDRAEEGAGGASGATSENLSAPTPIPDPSPLEGEGSLNPLLSDHAPPEEAALMAALRVVEGEVDEALQKEDFTRAMQKLAHLRAPVDAFFDKVLVNDPDPAVRLNRLRLLTQVRDTANRVADFSLISG